MKTKIFPKDTSLIQIWYVWKSTVHHSLVNLIILKLLIFIKVMSSQPSKILLNNNTKPLDAEFLTIAYNWMSIFLQKLFLYPACSVLFDQFFYIYLIRNKLKREIFLIDGSTRCILFLNDFFFTIIITALFYLNYQTGHSISWGVMNHAHTKKKSLITWSSGTDRVINRKFYLKLRPLKLILL